MKRTAIILIAACVALVACRKETSRPMEEDIVLTIALSGLPDATKTTTGVNETAVNSIQVFVFRKDGRLDGSSTSSGPTASVSCTAGERIVCALVNAPSVGAVTTLHSLQAKVTDLADNGVSSFIMYGTREDTITASSSITVNVSRLVARVTIRGIHTDWAADTYRDAAFRITGVYMINVPGECIYGDSSTYIPDRWYNRGAGEGHVPSLLSDPVTPVTIPNHGTYSTVHSFYVYPNSVTEDTTGGSWSPRKTRLVIEATLNGTVMYYPITLKKVEPNKAYTVTSLTITRPGCDSPDSLLDMEDMCITVTVSDWGGTESVTETI